MTLRLKTDDAPVGDDPKDAAIIDMLSDGDGRSTREIADAVGVSTRTVRKRLVRLVEIGRVREIGSGPNDPKRRYFEALD